MALEDDNTGAKTSADDMTEFGTDLTAEDREMLAKVAEVAAPQALEDGGSSVAFSEDVVIEGRKYQMTVSVELEEIEEGDEG